MWERESYYLLLFWGKLLDSPLEAVTEHFNLLSGRRRRRRKGKKKFWKSHFPPLFSPRTATKRKVKVFPCGQERSVNISCATVINFRKVKYVDFPMRKSMVGGDRHSLEALPLPQRPLFVLWFLLFLVA